MENKVRVRFAPSPTGGLHVGGVRTILFNYLFAKQHHGTFILRIEDTDQTRFVPGAEEYILDCLKWCGITPDEGQGFGGDYGPYKQSERKEIYKQYAQDLIEKGYAYYAFDTTQELENFRKEQANFQYNHATRLQMRNSLSLSSETVQQLLDEGTPNVIRIKMPKNEHIYFKDLIRGDVSFDTNLVDDKVLMKADGMPTYHLAVVVDDYLMKISHVFRGEEWLPSAPIHVMLWKYLGWEKQMPQWVHLPLILKPDGHGKLSKRDGERLGFPVYAMQWTDPKTGFSSQGFKDIGFLPQAFINLLALLGWNDSTENEIFSMNELIELFSLERVHKAGAKFDFEKAKWFNTEWIKQLSANELLPYVLNVLEQNNLYDIPKEYLLQVIDLVKDRCVLLGDFFTQTSFFFTSPLNIDTASLQAKWTEEKFAFFNHLSSVLESVDDWNAENLENIFKEQASAKAIKIGELMLPFRVMLVGGKFGPQVFLIAQMIGKAETLKRISLALNLIQK